MLNVKQTIVMVFHNIHKKRRRKKKKKKKKKKKNNIRSMFKLYI